MLLIVWTVFLVCVGEAGREVLGRGRVRPVSLLVTALAVAVLARGLNMETMFSGDPESWLGGLMGVIRLRDVEGID